jgi:hypothetical protein
MLHCSMGSTGNPSASSRYTGLDKGSPAQQVPGRAKGPIRNAALKRSSSTAGGARPSGDGLARFGDEAGGHLSDPAGALDRALHIALDQLGL